MFIYKHYISMYKMRHIIFINKNIHLHIPTSCFLHKFLPRRQLKYLFHSSGHHQNQNDDSSQGTKDENLTNIILIEDKSNY